MRACWCLGERSPNSVPGPAMLIGLLEALRAGWIAAPGWNCETAPPTFASSGPAASLPRRFPREWAAVGTMNFHLWRPGEKREFCFRRLSTAARARWRDECPSLWRQRPGFGGIAFWARHPSLAGSRIQNPCCPRRSWAGGCRCGFLTGSRKGMRPTMRRQSHHWRVHHHSRNLTRSSAQSGQVSRCPC